MDTVDLTVTPDDEKAKMKVKTPERTDDDKLNGYDGEDEDTITYKEEELTSGTKYPVTLNKLGEPDTKITITVTAEDGKTIKEYTVTIKRPYGVIKGSIYTDPTSNLGVYTADIRVYNPEKVLEEIQWETLQEGQTDDVHEKLISISSQNYVTEDNGKYEIYLIPGTYDILFDKEGYLDEIYRSIKLEDGETIELEQIELLAGDLNKDGIIEITDLSILLGEFKTDSSIEKFKTKVDFNKDNVIEITDLSILLGNYKQSRKIIVKE